MFQRNSVLSVTTGEFATIAMFIQTLYVNFFTNMVNLPTRFTWEKDLRILCSGNLFITENTEWVSFIIIAQSFKKIISKMHILRGVHECWKCSCTWMRYGEKMVLTLMKFKGIDIHLIRGYSYMYYNWSSCVVKVSKFILIQYFCGYILLYGMIPLRSTVLKYIQSPHPSGLSGPFLKCKDHTRSVSRLVSVFCVYIV